MGYRFSSLIQYRKAFQSRSMIPNDNTLLPLGVSILYNA